MKIFLILTFPGLIYSFGLSDLVDVIEVGKDVTQDLYKTYEVVSSNVDSRDPNQQFVDIPYTNKRQQAMLRYIIEISRKVNEMTSSINHLGNNAINDIVQQFPSVLKLELRQNELIDLVTRVNIAHETMMMYTDDDQIEQVTLEDFAQRVISHDVNSIRSILERIHYLVVPQNGYASRGILNLLLEVLQVSYFNPLETKIV